MAQGFRLGSKTKVVIEVNDKGETVQFDFADPSFLEKAQRMVLRVEELDAEFKSTGEFLEELDAEGIDDKDLMAEQMINLGTSMTKYFKGLRNTIDIFLGKGASQKIYGDENYIKMFEDLFVELEPYIDLASEKQMSEMKKAKETALNKIPQKNKRSL